MNKYNKAFTLTGAAVFALLVLLFAAGMFYFAAKVIAAFKKKYPNEPVPNPHQYTNQIVGITQTNGGFTVYEGDFWSGARSE
jgi:hypothetical protein